MLAKDLFHEAVKNALTKEGWTITDDPLRLQISLKVDFYAAEKDNDKIAVEVKSFAGNSDISEFHTALGQFLNYQDALEIKEPARVLFLAVPIDTYETFFQDAFIAASSSKHKLRILVYNPTEEVIEKWVK